MKFTTKTLVLMALFTALSVALGYFVHFPIFPSAPYLQYDPADIPILIGAFAFGPLAGVILTVIAAFIQAFAVVGDGFYGFLMHTIATSSLVVTASLIYRFRHTIVGGIVGLVSGTIVMGAVMVIANHFITPFYLGVPASAVDPLLLPVILPFNLIKAGINSVITFIVYKAISRYIVHGEKFGKGKSSAREA